MILDAEPEKIIHEIERAGMSEKVGFFGTQWIEWRVRKAEGTAYLSQTIFFSPRGLPGFLYWYFLYSFHQIRFRGLIRKIANPR